MKLGYFLKEKYKFIITSWTVLALLFTRFYMLGLDIVNRDSFHFKNWSYVFMKEYESRNWDKLFVTIQPGVLTIYSNIIGFKWIYFLKDKLGLIHSEGKEFELLLHTYQKVPQTTLIVILSLLIFFLIYKLFGFLVSVVFMTIYIWEPFFVIFSRFIQTDFLQAILIFSSFLLMFYWHRTSKLKYFFVSSVLAGLGFIEKSSTIAILPVVILFIGLASVRAKKDLKSRYFYRSWIFNSLIFALIYFSTAFIFFPAYWHNPYKTLLRMTLDAYIHGVEGINLDSYDFVRPDNVYLPVHTKLNFNLLRYFLYNHTPIFLGGILLFGMAPFINKKHNKKAHTWMYLLISLGFAIYYYVIIEISRLRMHRYLVVISVPLALTSSYGYALLLEKMKRVYALAFLFVISLIGFVRFVYLAPDWGAYHNILGDITHNIGSFAGGTGDYKLGEYLKDKYGDKKSVMIGDYTSLYLYYPGKVENYDVSKVDDFDLVISGRNNVDLAKRGFKKIDEYKRFDNIYFGIYSKQDDLRK